MKSWLYLALALALFLAGAYLAFPTLMIVDSIKIHAGITGDYSPIYAAALKAFGGIALIFGGAYFAKNA